MPMRTLWNAIEPNVYLTLFEWLAPIKEGRIALQEFAQKAVPAFANPTYLAYVVLTPVLKIVGHLTDICSMEGITNPNVANTMRLHKLRHQVTAYIARQYLAALVFASGSTTESKEDIHLDGKAIAQRKGVTEILLNLPREYQRWNKYYKQKGHSILPNPKLKRPPPRHTTVERPFDVECQIHNSFKLCVLEEQEQEYLPTPLELGDTWDPLTITKGLLANSYTNSYDII
jgi:hypothetical protein